MNGLKFSKWYSWENRNNIEGIDYPGIYAITLSSEVKEEDFSLIKEIVYFGMTNSLSGLKGRLSQFDNVVNKNRPGHGGAERFKHNEKNHEWQRQLKVAVASFKCDVKSQSAEAFKVMGDVAKAEYQCFAAYVDEFSKLPQYNDKKRSPKKSKN